MTEPVRSPLAPARMSVLWHRRPLRLSKSTPKRSAWLSFLSYSLRVRLILRHDSNIVVRELVMRSWQVDLGHVTGSAVFRPDLAELRSCLAARFRAAAGVTGTAFRIVMRCHPVDILMRIVATGATDPRVIYLEAFAVGQAVRLEPHVTHAVRSVFGDVFPGAMAFTAELRAFFRAHAGDLLHLRELSVAYLDSQ